MMQSDPSVELADQIMTSIGGQPMSVVIKALILSLSYSIQASGIGYAEIEKTLRETYERCGDLIKHGHEVN